MSKSREFRILLLFIRKLNYYYIFLALAIGTAIGALLLQQVAFPGAGTAAEGISMMGRINVWYWRCACPCFPAGVSRRLESGEGGGGRDQSSGRRRYRAVRLHTTLAGNLSSSPLG